MDESERVYYKDEASHGPLEFERQRCIPQPPHLRHRLFTYVILPIECFPSTHTDQKKNINNNSRGKFIKKKKNKEEEQKRK